MLSMSDWKCGDHKELLATDVQIYTSYLSIMLHCNVFIELEIDQCRQHLVTKCATPLNLNTTLGCSPPQHLAEMLTLRITQETHCTVNTCMSIVQFVHL